MLSNDSFCLISYPAARVINWLLLFPQVQVAPDFENRCCMREYTQLLQMSDSHMKDHFLTVFWEAFVCGLYSALD